MKNFIISSIIFLLLASPALQGQTSYKLEKGEIKIEGTSNVHDWVSTSTELTTFGDFMLATNALEGIKNLTVEIPVKSILSTKGSIMDKKTWRALNYDAHPNIKYVLQQINSIEKTGSSYLIKATGNLTIAGTTKRIDMTAKANVLANGKIEISGKKDLKMTTFNVDPPTALLGTMTTGDDLTIVFNLTLVNTKINSTANGK